MIPAEALLSSTLRALPDGPAVSRILAAALLSVEPGEVVRRSLQLEGEQLAVAGQSYDLTTYRRIFLLGIGKASCAMAEALALQLGAHLTAGLVVAKHSPADRSDRLTVLEGGHPLPDERSLAAGQKMLEFLSVLGPDDLLICLISGGGSALVSVPVPGVTLSDLQGLTSSLLGCGARVDEINTLRRHLDQIKGGGLVRLAHGAAVISLILSDVIGNPLEAIASGPTAPDPTTREEALGLIEHYSLRKKIPASILNALVSAHETLKPGEAAFGRVQNSIVGSNLLAAQSALKQAGQEGFHPYLLRTDLQGEARQVAFELATFLRQAKQTGTPVPPPACILAGGETTVTLRGRGRGGRNCELALAAVTELADFPGVLLVTLATDGEDGPTDAAGAVVTGRTFHRAAEAGLHPDEFLDRNDSYTFFAMLDDLLKPGPTGTNVNDLTFLFTF